MASLEVLSIGVIDSLSGELSVSTDIGFKVEVDVPPHGIVQSDADWMSRQVGERELIEKRCRRFATDHFEDTFAASFAFWKLRNPSEFQNWFGEAGSLSSIDRSAQLSEMRTTVYHFRFSNLTRSLSVEFSPLDYSGRYALSFELDEEMNVIDAAIES